MHLGSTGRRVAAATTAVLGATVLTACDGDAPFEPSLPSAAGYRADGDALRIWTGTPCVGVTRFALTFTTADGERQRLVLTAPPPGVTVEQLDIAQPDPAFTVDEQPTSDFDWRDAEKASLVIDAAEPAWGSVVDLSDVVDGSPEHPADAYLFDDVGWKDAADVADQNGQDFLTVCTPAADRG
ncbi:hypothetical protein KV102_01040 [Mumia sp. zg.B53]|uniref:hypothetical protein n=1 Tax=Mumia sp. zg.B53 TaxID=2855449 RepID=UPI001C6E9FFC|nr:hypothetical protein [Mumia sp. zg.B53]MBW9213413.1 hypothetical protein [Mumia sp. zg.B53]